MLPVVGGSSADTLGKGCGGPWIEVVSPLPPWNRSPSLVEVSQPLSHSRHAAVATRTRPALAPIAALPRQPQCPLPSLPRGTGEGRQGGPAEAKARARRSGTA